MYSEHIAIHFNFNYIFKKDRNMALRPPRTPGQAIDAEIVRKKKPKKVLRKDSLPLNFLLIAVIVLMIAGVGFGIGRYTTPEPTVKIKRVVTDSMGNEWFTIKHKVEDMDTPEEWKDTKYYAGFIQFRNMKSSLNGFFNVTHYTIGCTGDIFTSPGATWCTNDWIIKLTETISDSILTKYYK